MWGGCLTVHPNPNPDPNRHASTLQVRAAPGPRHALRRQPALRAALVRHAAAAARRAWHAVLQRHRAGGVGGWAALHRPLALPHRWTTATAGGLKRDATSLSACCTSLRLSGARQGRQLKCLQTVVRKEMWRCPPPVRRCRRSTGSRAPRRLCSMTATSWLSSSRSRTSRCALSVTLAQQPCSLRALHLQLPRTPSRPS